MAFSTRTLGTSHMRQASMSANPNAASIASRSLQTRVDEKRAELENLKQLRDLSAAVAGQMEILEQKLSTLSDGTEAIATVMANWHNVLRAINMASTKIPLPTAAGDDAEASESSSPALPNTLVRIPTEHAPTMNAHTEAALEDDSTTT